jgi:oligosaccharyltransferase complex subunit beta
MLIHGTSPRVLQVPVRPFKHDEYERFLGCAYPYYASALSTMLAFAFLGLFFLYHKQ